jgi:hypothetical protein
MSRQRALAIEVTHHVRNVCLCLHVQQAARGLARRFDEALKPTQLTNGQFFLLMSLNREEAPNMGKVANYWPWIAPRSPPISSRPPSPRCIALRDSSRRLRAKQ